MLIFGFDEIWATDFTPLRGDNTRGTGTSACTLASPLDHFESMISLRVLPLFFVFFVSTAFDLDPALVSGRYHR